MNELKFETSPYLLQHKNNPIYWKAWNQDSLQQAQTQNKLLVISIGYSACHWCHVMEHECFEDNDVAEIMNEHFVSIKVDREERPDVDAIYMKALQLMIRQGGWPLNVVCLPDGRPVWGATYVNKQNWIESLIELQALFENSKDRMIEYADKLQLGINHIGLIDAPDVENPFDLKITEPLIAKWQKSFDWEFGGPARAPKFMMPTNLNFLQNYGSYTNNPELLSFVDLTLTKMAYGGLFDVVDGGFSRYSVDVRWHIPHFEKMLYDNGQLLQTYALAYKRTQNPIYKNICYKTYNFIKENWILKNGLVQSAYDADSIDDKNVLKEGAFYFWKKEELQEILKEDFTWFSELYNINDFGYWEDDVYVFIQTQSIEQIAHQFNFCREELIQKNDFILSVLKNYRNTNRQLPRLDDKCLTAWNAIFAIGCLECYEAFGDDEFLNSAEKNTNTILNTLLDNETGILYRNYKDNKITISGFLDDYAFLIKALIKLYQSTLQLSYLNQAKQITDYVIDNFYNENIGLFEYKNKNDEKLIATHFEIEDNVIPSSNAIMGQNLWLLSIIFENEYYKKVSKNMCNQIIESVDYGSAFSDWLQLFLWQLPSFEYHVIVGEKAKENIKKETERYIVNTFLIGTDIENDLPIFKNKWQQNKNLKFVCNNISCTDRIEM